MIVVVGLVLFFNLPSSNLGFVFQDEGAVYFQRHVIDDIVLEMAALAHLFQDWCHAFSVFCIWDSLLQYKQLRNRIYRYNVRNITINIPFLLSDKGRTSS